MIMIWIILITFASGVLAWLASYRSHAACRLIPLAGLGVDAVLVIALWAGRYHALLASTGGPWISEATYPWIPRFGTSLHFAMDGLGLLLVALTVLLGIVSVLASWPEIRHRAGLYYFLLMTVLAGIIGVFTTIDLFLFYFFWELMLVPMYFLIAGWGHERRVAAAAKFFIFTQAGGLFMLLSILAVYEIHGRQTGVYTFNYAALLGTAGSYGLLVLLGFFVAFAVKLPAVPLHTWLPDAHTEAPTAGSIVLAGLLLKTGAYGFLRFAIPLFPSVIGKIAPWAMALGVIGIIYGAFSAFAQRDLKRLIAYTSVSHLGFALLGIFAGGQTALQGAVIVLLAHGMSTGALFFIAGTLQRNLGTRDMDAMGGLWSVAPKMGGMTIFFVLASLGLPGLANFIGEFFVLVGTFRLHPALSVIAALGLIFSTVYALWIVYRVFHGPMTRESRFADLGAIEMAALAALIAGVVWIGILPQTVLNTARGSLERVEKSRVESSRLDPRAAPPETSLIESARGPGGIASHEKLAAGPHFAGTKARGGGRNAGE